MVNKVYNHTAYVPPRPLVMDPQYAHVALPTSATRLNVATNWTYHPHPWPDGSQPPFSYPIPGHLYYPSHYRSNSVPSQHQESTSNGHNTQPPGSSHSSPADTTSSKTSNPSGKDSSTVQIIDPSLPSGTTTLTEQQVLAITEAAVKAVLEAEAGSSRAESRSGSVLTSLHSEGETGERIEEVSEKPTVVEPHITEKTGGLPGYGTPLQRPEPMEHMLTEDGEPMLNPGQFAICSEAYLTSFLLPAELLTQASSISAFHLVSCWLINVSGIVGFPSTIMT